MLNILTTVQTAAVGQIPCSIERILVVSLCSLCSTAACTQAPTVQCLHSHGGKCLTLTWLNKIMFMKATMCLFEGPMCWLINWLRPADSATRTSVARMPLTCLLDDIPQKMTLCSAVGLLTCVEPTQYCCSRYNANLASFSLLNKSSIWRHVQNVVSADVWNRVDCILELLFIRCHFYTLQLFTFYEIDSIISFMCTVYSFDFDCVFIIFFFLCVPPIMNLYCRTRTHGLSVDLFALQTRAGTLTKGRFRLETCTVMGTTVIPR